MAPSPTSSDSGGVGSRRRRTTALAVLCLAVALLAALPHILGGIGTEFIAFDDEFFLAGNEHLRGGWSAAGVRWAFTSIDRDNWQPVTWLSYLLDVSLFGPNPFGHRAVNLVLYAATCGLFVVALFRMTGSLARSGFAAALFAAHPLHVEPVAWITERNDMLAGLFFMLLLLAYAWHAARPSWRRLAAVALLLALALMSKTVVIAVPAILLLLDFWPLGRTSILPPASGSLWRPLPWTRLALEKVPLAALSLGAGAVTLFARRRAGGLPGLEDLSAGDRLVNSIASIKAYLAMVIWPSGLAPFYPPPARPPLAGALLSSVIFLALTWLALRRVRRAPWLLVGWLWFLVMLTPVSGIVQAGDHVMADRYVYLPLAGLSITLAWGSAGLVRVIRKARVLLSVLGFIAVALLMAATVVQVRRWRESETLFRHTLSVTRGNWKMMDGLGNVLARKGDREGAIRMFEESIRSRPDFAGAHENLGVTLGDLGRFDDGILHLKEAVRLRPDSSTSHYNLGVLLVKAGRPLEAFTHFGEAVRINPAWPEARENLGYAAALAGDLPAAIGHYRTALGMRPGSVTIRYNLAAALLAEGAAEEALAVCREALALDPADPGLRGAIEALAVRASRQRPAPPPK